MSELGLERGSLNYLSQGFNHKTMLSSPLDSISWLYWEAADMSELFAKTKQMSDSSALALLLFVSTRGTAQTTLRGYSLVPSSAIKNP